jgi:gas vesicle protein
MTDSEDRPDIDDSAPEAEGRWRARGFVTGIAVGALLGAGLALFLTSGRGRRVAQRVRDDWDDLKDDARRQLGRRKKDLRAKFDRVAREAKEAVEEAFD